MDEPGSKFGQSLIEFGISRQGKGVAMEQERQDKVFEILMYIPPKIRNILLGCIRNSPWEIEEIRLRAGLPLGVSICREFCYVTPFGSIANDCFRAYTVTPEEVEWCFQAVCEHSVYAHTEEIRQGYITLPGGHRVGFAGRAVVKEGRVTALHEIGSLNLRIARQMVGCADGIMPALFSGGRIVNTLLVSPPLVGKTTMLRDIARQVSNLGYATGIADDRGEIAAVYHGVPSNDVGMCSDVISGGVKEEAVRMLIRTMAPRVIITDEVAEEGEFSALSSAVGSGVAVIASIHGTSLEDVRHRCMGYRVLGEGLFSQAVILSLSGTGHDIRTEVVKIV